MNSVSNQNDLQDLKLQLEFQYPHLYKVFFQQKLPQSLVFD